MAKQGQGEREQRGYLSGVEMSRRMRPSRRHPCDGCGGRWHITERAHLAAWRSLYRCTQAVGIPVMGAWEAASHGAAQYGHGRVQVVPGKAAEAPAGRVMLTVGK